MAVTIHSEGEVEESLVYKAAKGNLEAFNELMFSYQHLAYNHAYALVGDPDTADDITQESLIKAFRSIHGFRGGSFRSWLLKIVTNTSYDQLRKSRRFLTLPISPKDEDGNEMDSLAWLADNTIPVQVVVEQNEDMSHLYRLIDEMPAVYRSVITLIDLFEIDYKEAAGILKVPLGTIKSRLARARMQIKERLQQDQV